MIYFLTALGLGIGLGCSISSARTRKLDNGIICTKFIKIFCDCKIGWKYERNFERGNYKISLFFYKQEPTPKSGSDKNWFSWKWK